MTGHRLCGLSDLTDGQVVGVAYDGRELAVVRIGESVYALDSLCSHQEVSLLDGEVDVDECALECPKHGALFSLADGVPLSLPATRSVETIPLAVVGDDVMVVVQ